MKQEFRKWIYLGGHSNLRGVLLKLRQVLDPLWQISCRSNSTITSKGLMEIRVADSFTDILFELIGDEQKAY